MAQHSMQAVVFDFLLTLWTCNHHHNTCGHACQGCGGSLAEGRSRETSLSKEENLLPRGRFRAGNLQWRRCGTYTVHSVCSNQDWSMLTYLTNDGFGLGVDPNARRGEKQRIYALPVLRLKIWNQHTWYFLESFFCGIKIFGSFVCLIASGRICC